MISVDPRIVPFPASNAQFLRAIFGEQWPRALITAFAGDPEKPEEADWTAWPAKMLPSGAKQRQLNTYYCPSLVSGNRRVLHKFESFHVIVVDDYGTKVVAGAPEEILGRPSYMLETSPGNFQAGWLLEKQTDLAWVRGLLRSLSLELGAPDNLGDPMVWRRLPVGINGKAGYRDERGKPWRVSLAGALGEGRITAADWPAIEQRLGNVVRPASLGGQPEMPDPGEIENDVVLYGFRRLGRVIGLGRQTTMGWGYDVECPWSGEHSSRAEEGAVYVPVLERFCCQHGHCAHRTVGEARERLNALLRDESGGLDSLARHDFEDVSVARAKVGAKVDDGDAPALAAYEATEDGLTCAFVDQHRDRLRFDHIRGKWFQWTGEAWRADEVAHAFDWARRLIRQYRVSLIDITPAQARVLGKIAVAAAIERAARADEALAVSGRDWDRDPWLAGAPGCTIDLRTGKIRQPERGDLITKQLLVAPDGRPTPIWDRFLEESTGGDSEVIGFLQAWSGYCLTGDISEEKFVFIYGPGGNGKGTFLYAVNAIANDYAVRTPADTFMLRKYDAHPAEIADLAGARMVMAAEIEEGRIFNAGRLKDFTGRDGKLSARFMRQDWFQFTPQFKIIFVGNNQPRIINVDDAMRRRTILIPFIQTPAFADITLKDRLVPEYPGILRWMIEGEKHRRKMGGLTALLPRAAAQATDTYLDGQDTLKGWAQECLAFDGKMESRHEMGVLEAFEDYKLWCQRRGIPTELSLQDFSSKFLKMYPSCTKVRTNRGFVFRGAKLSPQDVR